MLGTLQPGFPDPVDDSQSIFRAVLDALSRPGRLAGLDALPGCLAPPLQQPTVAILLALADADTPVWLDGAARQDDIAGYLRFHCGCPLVDAPAQATFAVITDTAAMPPLDAFAPGTPDYPDRGATLILQVPSLDGGTAVIARGPGIDGDARLAPSGLPDAFWSWRLAQQELFPCGVDLLFVADGRVLGLPRSTRLEV